MRLGLPLYIILDLFGEMDVLVDTLLEMAEKIIAGETSLVRIMIEVVDSRFGLASIGQTEYCNTCAPASEVCRDVRDTYK
jgi:hypothetical protein